MKPMKKSGKPGNYVVFIMAIGVCFFPLNMVRCSEVAINPIPRKLTVEKGEVIPSPNGVIIIGEKPSKPVRYIAEKIAFELKNKFNLDYKTVKAIDESKSKFSQIIFSKEKNDLPEEGFSIQVKSLNDSCVAVVDITANDDRGFVYAGYTLINLLREKNGKAMLPKLKLSDWPALRNRIPSTFTFAEETICKPAGCDFSGWLEHDMDWLLRYRFNSIYILPYPEHFRKVIGKNLSPLVLDSAFIDNVHSRGLKAFIVWNYLFDFAKQGRCFSNPADVSAVLLDIKNS